MIDHLCECGGYEEYGKEREELTISMYKFQHELSTLAYTLVARRVVGWEDVEMDFADVDFVAAAEEPVACVADVGYWFGGGVSYFSLLLW